jgi:hypothetical protein
VEEKKIRMYNANSVQSVFKREPFRAVGILLIIIPLLAAVFLFALNTDLSQSFPYFFLLPWIFLLLVFLLIPIAILLRQGEFSLANPLVFSVWAFFFPAFVLGGLALITGWSNPYFLTFIQDPETTLPLTIILIILGYSALSMGYFLPFGAKLGRFVSDRLDEKLREERATTLVIPGLILLLLGVLNSAIAVVLGTLGYKQGSQIASYEGLVFLTTMFWVEATFLLWYSVFRRARQTSISYAIMGLLVLSSIFRALVSGSRAMLLQGVIIVIFSFVLSGRALSIKKTLLITLSFCLAVVIGMIYGSFIRDASKENQGAGFESYVDNMLVTFETIGRNTSSDSLEFGLNTLAERLDILSSLAVVVSNYQQLEPYEETYGLKDNISKDLATTFIPRVIWPEKPQITDLNRLYGELYFNYGDNSFAMTPIGDLLRNFGVVGIFVGMLIVGILLRFIYGALIRGTQPSIFRATLYFMLLSPVNYEGFYSLIFSYMIKIGIISVIGLLLVKLIASQIRPNDKLLNI